MVAGCSTKAGIAVNKHLWGYEKSVYVKNDLPDVTLYWPITGVENKVWWDLPTVQDRAMRLAEIYGYEGADIACDYTGNWLYIGVD